MAQNPQEQINMRKDRIEEIKDIVKSLQNNLNTLNYFSNNEKPLNELADTISLVSKSDEIAVIILKSKVAEHKIKFVITPEVFEKMFSKQIKRIAKLTGKRISELNEEVSNLDSEIDFWERQKGVDMFDEGRGE
jgi:hypothetical protein